MADTPNASRHMPFVQDKTAPVFALEKPNGLAPSDEEVERNPRARSARLRYGIRQREQAVMHA